jgi:hypothetical protein
MFFGVGVLDFLACLVGRRFIPGGFGFFLAVFLTGLLLGVVFLGAVALTLVTTELGSTATDKGGAKIPPKPAVDISVKPHRVYYKSVNEAKQPTYGLT